MCNMHADLPNACLRLRVKSLCHDLTDDIVPVLCQMIQDIIVKLIVTNIQGKCDGRVSLLPSVFKRHTFYGRDHPCDDLLL